ncbi:TetR/AcrR family transcriptional regulator [Pseudonocardia sp. DSM 110487]|uniref:TetR/AcrR family transcriptional regulator n=1 Tax=Pseudonocardia sp. DSM 110487 TaxID=2865833 RepID=UPI001C6999DE|nr:TetR/AcrR family transcriptional regulator [Pseudonocardia sp. DSM 110487]QYN37076.1 TetR/AcrR family transcriptional regulator [Pseudonocardia sp. DSM 110487]
MSTADDARERILGAAFSAFMEAGYAATSTLEIATRARVSKRELYALVGNKQQMLEACVRERATRLRTAADLPEPRDIETLEAVLVAFGSQLLREVTDSTVVAVFRLAIAEATRAPEVARTLHVLGPQASRAALTRIMEAALAHEVLTGRAPELAERFAGLLWGDLLIRLLLRVADTPTPIEIDSRARSATSAFLQLHS